MKVSYNWLKSYVPELIEVDKLYDIFTYHLCEVEGIEKQEKDTIFDINILPNRAHDLLSHQGVARELAGQLGLSFKLSEHKVSNSQSTKLSIEIKTDKCRRYMGRIIRNVKVGPSPDWMKDYLEAIGQRSINNIVDTTNIVMYDCGQPTHAFDLKKLNGEKIIVRQANDGEVFTTLDGKEPKLTDADMMIADEKQPLAIAGVKGGKMAEVDGSTTDILIEVANFDPVSVRKTSRRLQILTDSSKRFENDLSADLGDFAMKELSALIAEILPDAQFEDVVDQYPIKEKESKVTFSTDFINKKLGTKITSDEIEKILKDYHFTYQRNGDNFELASPSIRKDLVIKEDIVDEIGRIYGYDKVVANVPKINFAPKVNETYAKILATRNKLLTDGYSEVMTYAFCDRGEVEVLASASDKKFLRTNLSNGLKESLKLNQLNAPLLELKEVKIFEIGTVFKKDKEEIHVAWNEKKEMKETTLDEFTQKNPSLEKHENSLLEIFSVRPRQDSQGFSQEDFSARIFEPWSVYPFISRDVAVWMPEGENPVELEKLLKKEATGLLVKGPYVFDSFTKNGKTSYAFRLVFQSSEKTLTDDEINVIMTKISHKIKENSRWELR